MVLMLYSALEPLQPASAVCCGDDSLSGAVAKALQGRVEAIDGPSLGQAARSPTLWVLSELNRAITVDRLCSLLQSRWDVEVVPEKFWGHDLVDSIAEVRTMDVFMGMHGAGFVNSFYLQPVQAARSCRHANMLTINCFLY